MNALLCGLEGTGRRVPSREEFADALSDASATLRAAFPSASVIDYDSERLSVAYGLLAAFGERRGREMTFLVQAAPLIAQRPSRRTRRRAERDIVQLAASLRLPLTSLAVICALSCVYESPSSADGSIGRGVLKPHLSYVEDDAYNAVADVQALEVFGVTLAVSGGRAALVTRDRALTNLWLCLHMDRLAFGDEQFNTTMTPSPDLFPDLSEEEVRDLVIRLAS